MAEKFNHPFEPYDIQRQFMTALYQCLDDGKVGIFESPTGTGKSLSLICGSLTWLRDHKRRQLEVDSTQRAGSPEEPDWLLEHARAERQREVLQRRQELEARLRRVREKENQLKQRSHGLEHQLKRQKASHVRSNLTEEAVFALDDYESDDEQFPKTQQVNGDDNGFSAETQALMSKLGMPLSTGHTNDETDDVDELKIFFCSRTHSQLSQFANELRRVKIPPIGPFEPPHEAHQPGSGVGPVDEAVRQITLASRKNLCIHPQVSKIGSPAAINERCLELQDAKTSMEHRCSYMPNKDNLAAVNEFRDHALAKVRDIEDLGAIGKRFGICPYYASRAAVKPSEIVTLPYPLLLQKTARDALGISVKDHVVIIDEAHNLMDAISDMQSMAVSLSRLALARSQLMMYLQKFRARLKGKNRVYVAQTVRLLDSAISCLEERSKTQKMQEAIVNVSDITGGKGVDQINLYKLSHYLQESKLARKVDGYTSFTIDQSKGMDGPAQGEGRTPALTIVQSFLLTLMNPSEEGRFFAALNNNQQDVELRYLLLDPTSHFKDIVDEARAVVLAGGTMSPMSDYTQHLFSYLDSSRMTTLSCDHIIPATSLLAVPLTAAVSGRSFDFTFENRMLEHAVLDLGRTLLSLAQTIPDGFVVFFPSYAYLEHCVKAWQSSASSGAKPLWHNLQGVKSVFRETQTKAKSDSHRPDAETKSTESVLSAYSTAVTSGDGRGALLLAVIGGSLSEGINFSDSLGRGVAVVGLPFANPHSAEWKAKMGYISSKRGKEAARDFYTNVCMRAVNQAIGRAIRHKGDYAAVFLLDRRYGTKGIQEKLPGWIKSSVKGTLSTEQAVEETRLFFQGKAIA